MSEATATVEVLTAEVRVLMVGSRQVTLSVFGQLDTVSYEEQVPFGRVRANKHEGLWVVGRRRANGDLVKARHQHDWRGWPIYLDDPEGPAVEHWLAHTDSQPGHVEGDTIYRIGGGVELVMNVPNRYYARCPFGSAGQISPDCDYDELAAAAAPAVNEAHRLHDELVAERRAVEELPLIVLAGLR